ncbi:MAG: YggS family pyridoxal phosphate-dependent enzyme [Steroidobacter sp.]
MLTGPHFSADATANAAARNLWDRFEQTRTRIASAALRYGRSADSVGLVAVSKTQPAERIRTLADCGQRDFGENYLQEALQKIATLADPELTWHFIGQIQTNKTRPIAENFHWVHTLDRERIAVRLHEQRPHYSPPLNICIQVRLADEPGKGGVAPAELSSLAHRIRELPRLHLRGLMCIPPPRESFEEQQAVFAQLAGHQQALIGEGFALDTLSMGMSMDLEAAIAAGATWVRIGTAIFGERPA